MSHIQNPFVALCKVASEHNWCWKLYCTTCGHILFEVSFSKMIQGRDPGDESFWPYGKENYSPLELDTYQDFFRSNSTIENQVRLASIVSKAQLSDIQSIATFPDWLGYIGLVLYHCDSNAAGKIISDSFLPQFIDLVKEKDTQTYTYLLNKQANNERLTITDLSILENVL